MQPFADPATGTKAGMFLQGNAGMFLPAWHAAGFHSYGPAMPITAKHKGPHR
jgi:hypothetical protein